MVAAHQPVHLDSGPPWHVTCHAERIGDDYLCRLHRGDHHDHRVEAIGVARWSNSAATSKTISSSSPAAGAVAHRGAHRICRAGRRDVECVVGLRLDALSPRERRLLLATCDELIGESALEIEARRCRAELSVPFSMCEQITAHLGSIRAAIDAFMDAPPDPERIPATGDRHVCIFAPLYLSNACANDCAYCGFRRTARFDRIVLDVNQALEEARHLVAQGHRTIDLVTGEVPTDSFAGYVCEVIERIRAQTGIRRINLNLGALSDAQFRRLRGAGATGYHLYQETYDPDVYFRVHRRGRKRDMAARLEAPHRAANAGFEAIGLGILVGLAPLRDELARLVRHADILRTDFPELKLGFSLPRVQPADAACGFVAPVPVGDDTFVSALQFLRARFPSAHLTLTTRERPELRDRLLALGVTKVSAGVSTRPGGYASADDAAEPQFEIADQRSVAAIASAIRQTGLTATFE